MTLKEMLYSLQIKLQKLKNNKLAPFSYEQSAYDNDTVEGTDTYDFSKEQNIPIANADVLQVNPTILSKGFRSQVSSLPRMLLNHFFGRTSYNLNKIVDFVTYLTTSLTSLFDKAGGIPTLDSETLLSIEQLPKGSFCYKGEWDAETNTPQLTHGVGKKGDVYKVVKSGNQTLGSSDEIYYNINSFVFNTGNKWLVLGGGSGTVININDVYADNEGNLTLKAEHIPYNTEKNVKEMLEAIETGSWEGTNIDDTIKKILHKYYPNENKKRINDYVGHREFRNLTDELPFFDYYESISKGELDLQLGDYWLLCPNYDEKVVNIILNHRKEHITYNKYDAKGHSLAYNILESIKETKEASDALNSLAKSAKEFSEGNGITLDALKQKFIDAENALNNLNSCLAFFNMLDFYFYSEFDTTIVSNSSVFTTLTELNTTVGLEEDYLQAICLTQIILDKIGLEKLKELLLYKLKDFVSLEFKNKKKSIELFDACVTFVSGMKKILTKEDLQVYKENKNTFEFLFSCNSTSLKHFLSKYLTVEEAHTLAKQKLSLFTVENVYSVQYYFVVFGGYGFTGEAKFIFVPFIVPTTRNDTNGFITKRNPSSNYYTYSNNLKLLEGLENLTDKINTTKNISISPTTFFTSLLRCSEDVEKILKITDVRPFTESIDNIFSLATFVSSAIPYSFSEHTLEGINSGFLNTSEDSWKFNVNAQFPFEFVYVPLLFNIDVKKDFFSSGIIRILNDLYRRFNFTLLDCIVCTNISNLTTQEDVSYIAAYNKFILRSSAFFQTAEKGLYPDLFQELPITSNRYQSVSPFGNKLIGNNQIAFTAHPIYFGEKTLFEQFDWYSTDDPYTVNSDIVSSLPGFDAFFDCTVLNYNNQTINKAATSFCLTISDKKIKEQKIRLKYNLAKNGG